MFESVKPKIEKRLNSFRIGLFNLSVLIFLPVLLFLQDSQIGCCTGTSAYLENIVWLQIYLLAWLLLNICETCYRLSIVLESEVPNRAGELVFVWLGSLPLLFISIGTLPMVSIMYIIFGLLGLLAVFETYDDLPIKDLRLYLACLMTFGLIWFLTPRYGVTGDHYGRISVIKSNMHTLKTMAETYHRDYGAYPPNLKALKSVVTKPGKEYWRDFHNPMSGQSGLGASLQDWQDPFPAAFQNWLGIQIYMKNGLQGQVIYHYLTTQQYRIYGLDKNGDFIRDRGRIFKLTQE